MSGRYIFAGDSITANYSWPDTVTTTRGATNVARTPENTLTSPAYAGSTLSHHAGNAGYPAMVDYFTGRVGNYCDNTTWLYVLLGVNDLHIYADTVTYAAYIEQEELEKWRGGWDLLNTAIVALGANQPAKVIVMGLPWMTGWGIPAANLVDWMHGSIAYGRWLFNGVTQDACTRHGWTYLSLNTMTPDMIGADLTHPNAAGVAYLAAQVLAGP